MAFHGTEPSDFRRNLRAERRNRVILLVATFLYLLFQIAAPRHAGAWGLNPNSARQSLMKHITIPTDGFLDGNRFRVVTLRLALIYAAAEFLISSPIWLTIGNNPLKPLLGKLALEAVFVLVAILLAGLLSRMRRQSYGRQIAACLLLSLVSSLGMSLLDAYLCSLIMLPVVVPFNIMDYAYAVCYRMSIFFGWSFLFVALLNHMDVRDRDLKLIASREEALAAQMRALQYQINPHFLFNTLNSITGLVEEGASERAERMHVAFGLPALDAAARPPA
ncbi:histidine kinase [Ensifer sp. OTU672]|uniref:histidine kinase n=1 Tax=Ensifer sp. OTU672 TaxID=3043861 RepID=UPI00313B04C4